MSHPELLRPTEQGPEVQNAAQERAGELQKSRESGHEQSPEQQTKRVEIARIETEGAFAKEAGHETKQRSEPSAPRAVRRVTKNEKAAAYRQTMRHIRAEMSAPARTFSKFIHSPIVERSSDIIGGTLARPDAILAGSSTALILVISVYILARTFGYQLSGFETIGSFILGWLIGLIYDYVRIVAFGRRA